eukprot:scaffold22577_cov122-Cylindrotheca_fusiformis.AAC.36
MIDSCRVVALVCIQSGILESMRQVGISRQGNFQSQADERGKESRQDRGVLNSPTEVAMLSFMATAYNLRFFIGQQSASPRTTCSCDTVVALLLPYPNLQTSEGRLTCPGPMRGWLYPHLLFLNNANLNFPSVLLEERVHEADSTSRCSCRQSRRAGIVQIANLPSAAETNAP